MLDVLPRAPRTWLRGLWPAALMLVGCGPGAYPDDAVLRVNHLQAKGSHNSYHIGPDDMTIPALNYTHAPLDVQLEDQGCRHFELDVHYNKFNKTFAVYHEDFDTKTTCDTLEGCLSILKTWSDAHPQHHPLFVQIEMKDSVSTEEAAETYLTDLESTVLSVWARDGILAPDDVRGEAATLRDGLAENGWPTLGETRGKIAFFLDNNDLLRDVYTHGEKDLDGRLFFADGAPSDPWAGIVILNDPNDADLPVALAANLVVRTRADGDNVEPLAGDTSVRDKALASGAQLVSTDYPAPVEGVDYVVEMPGGTPSRCNPVTAPSNCQSEDIENPDHLGLGAQDAGGDPEPQTFDGE